MSNLLKFSKVIILLIITFFVSCTTPEKVTLTPTKFNGYTEINAGDSATISWEIANATKVRVLNLKRNFDAIDSIKVAPLETTIYDIVASAPNSNDTLKLNWRVYVNGEKSVIQRGPDLNSNIAPSYNESDYLSGIIDANTSPKLHNLKILRYQYSPTGKNNVLLRLLPLDEFGNYITNFDDKQFSLNYWNIINNCNNVKSTEPVSEIKEINHKNDSVNFDMAICLDNSSFASDYYSVYDQLLYFTSSLSDKDNLKYTLFNHKILQDIPLLPTIHTNDKLNSSKPDSPDGFSAIYKVLYNNAKTLAEANNKNEKAVVLIAYSTDNSSLIYDRNDVIEICKKYNIPVYVIGIGNAVDSYSMSYICEHTGGKYYFLNEDEIYRVRNILGEVAFSLKNYYSLEYPISLNLLSNCKKINSEVSFSSSIGKVQDSISINLLAEKEFFRYQAVASFKHRDTILDKSFDEPLAELAQILKDNPKVRVELVGNASIEGNEAICNELAINRARAVRKALIAMGTNPNQISVRNDGSNNPVYYFQETEKTQYFNRRVEIRWLNPELLPFEIIAGWAVSETDALTMVEDWENKGYRCYYERYLQNNNPVYRVKIWGYPTMEEAEKIAGNLKKTYKQEFTVQ